ncbi:MAG: hypothetical protein AB7I01_10715 [Gammaproteobacteria bacterium]
MWLVMCATGAALAQDAPAPDAALLEFLGEWTDASGRFVDPTLEGVTPSAGEDVPGEVVPHEEVQDEAP